MNKWHGSTAAWRPQPWLLETWGWQQVQLRAQQHICWSSTHLRQQQRRQSRAHTRRDCLAAESCPIPVSCRTASLAAAWISPGQSLLTQSDRLRPGPVSMPSSTHAERSVEVMLFHPTTCSTGACVHQPMPRQSFVSVQVNACMSCRADAAVPWGSREPPSLAASWQVLLPAAASPRHLHDAQGRPQSYMTCC